MRLKLPETNLTWLWKRTLFLTRHGSHAYGTNIEGSDEDFKGFAVPPKIYFHGYSKTFEQAEFKKDPDMVVYGAKKFFKLAADCNPSIIEVLFTDPSDHQIVHPLGAVVLQNRDLFISRKAKFTFSGYAVSQLKKIKSHYKWISNPPKAPPTREEFGLPERTVIPQDQLQAAQSMIKKQIDKWNVPIDELDPAQTIAVQERFAEALALISVGYKGEILRKIDHYNTVSFYTQEAQDAVRAVTRELWEKIDRDGVNLERIAGNLLGFDDNFLDLLDRERGYRNKMEEWRSYQTWLATRNEKRSELERKWGYDTKHGMHLVRLMRMGVEIMEGRGVIVKRPDAEELLAIRNGLWKYEDLLQWAENQEKRLDELYVTSPLPKSPPVTKLDAVLQDVVQKGLDTLEE